MGGGRLGASSSPDGNRTVERRAARGVRLGGRPWPRHSGDRTEPSTLQRKVTDTSVQLAFVYARGNQGTDAVPLTTEWAQAKCKSGPRKFFQNLVSGFQVSPPPSSLFRMKRGLEVGEAETERGTGRSDDEARCQLRSRIALASGPG